MREMRTNHPDESVLMFVAFDILFQDGVDLRGLPLSERKRDLARLCCKAKVPCMYLVDSFPDGRRAARSLQPLRLRRRRVEAAGLGAD